MEVKYRFTGCRVFKNAEDILNDLKSFGVVGVASMPYLGVVEVEFSKEPTQDQLEQIKNSLIAQAYEKVIEEEPIMF